MKRVINIMCLLVLTLFVSGYTYNVEMTISDNNSIVIKKDITKTEEDVKKLCPNQTCEVGSMEYFDAYNKTKFKDENYDSIVNYELEDNEENGVSKTKIVATMGDIDDNVGPAQKKFNLINTNFKTNLLKMDGLTYVSNIEFNPLEGFTEGTFELIVPTPLFNSNATTKDDANKTYTWDLTKVKSIEFEYKTSNIEVAGEKEYNIIEMNKYLTIGAGVVGGIIVLILILNIFKKIKKEPIQDNTEENNKFAVNDVFNSNANITTPVSNANEIAQQPITLEQPENHQDIISNKFLDASFAGNATPEVTPEPTPVVSSESSDTLDGSIDVIPIEDSVDLSATTRKDDNNTISDMSSVAFGGTPIDDKNINEIK